MTCLNVFSSLKMNKSGSSAKRRSLCSQLFTVIMSVDFNYCRANYDIILRSSNVLIVQRSLCIFLPISRSVLIIILSVDEWGKVRIEVDIANFSLIHSLKIAWRKCDGGLFWLRAFVVKRFSNVLRFCTVRCFKFENGKQYKKLRGPTAAVCPPSRLAKRLAMPHRCGRWRIPPIPPAYLSLTYTAYNPLRKQSEFNSIFIIIKYIVPWKYV